MNAFRKQQQLRLYQEQMGREAAQRQQDAATAARGGCVCQVRTVKKRWDGETLSEKKVHQRGCPKFKWWMEEA